MSSLKRLISYAQAFRKDMVLATAYSVINKVFDILPEVLIGVAVDIVVNKKHSFLARLGVIDLLNQLLVLGGLTLAAFSLESIFQYLYQVKWRNLAQALQHSMRLDAYSHVQRLDTAYFEDKSTGNLLSIINDDINQLERFLDGGASALIQVLASSLLIGGIFFYLSPTVAMVALLPLPVILWGAYKFQHLLGPRYAKVRKMAGLISARLSNNLIGMPTIKSYTKEAFELKRLAKDSEAYQLANESAIKMSSAFIPSVRMAIVAGFIATLVLGGYLTVNGSLAVASYSVLVFLTQRLLWPFTRLAEMTDLYQRAMASADRVLDLIETPILIKDGKKELTDFSGDIVFDHVGFSYGNGKELFRDLNLTIKSGQTVALVGSTGAGKSTIIKLLLRFYAESHGRILIGATDISELRLKNLRRAISYVCQDVFLFSGTIRENIAYGQDHPVSDADIIKAAKIAEIHNFIESLPKGYQTLVGERGINLSGGQAQRLSIARAVLKDSPIFILDEATSAVDNETEEAIQRSLKKIVVGRSSIVIAHRLSTIRHADAIYVLDEGKIIESGTHEELLEKKGVYARLWQIQTGVIS